MEISTYQQCPCHSGKKIKFCCGKDIVSELNQIVGKIQSKQTQSAIDQIDRLTEKSGKRDCLVTLKTKLLINIGEIEMARELNKHFLDKQPNHPLAKHHEALICLSEGDVESAISALQDATEGITGDELPLFLSGSFQFVGAALLRQGQLIAARAHLHFSEMLRGEADESTQRMLYESYRLPSAPLNMKGDFRLGTPPESEADADWAKKYQNVLRAVNRGMFRKAFQILERIDEHWPNQKTVVRSKAIVESMLATRDQSEAWRQLSGMEGLPHWEAVECESIAQLLSNEPASGTIDVVRETYQLKDLDATFQLLSADSRLQSTTGPESNPFEEGPPPRYCFLLLNKERLDSAEELKLEEIPLLAGEILLFGKQTDREARLILVGTENANYHDARDFLVKLLDDQISGEPEKDVLTKTATASDILSWDWSLPEGITREQHKALVDQQRTNTITESWINLPFDVLGGKSPADASSDDSLKIKLEALVLNLEQAPAIQNTCDEAIATLKEKLNIAPLEKFDAKELENETLSPMRMRQVDVTTLSDDQLLNLQSSAMTVGNYYFLKDSVPEILKREHLQEKFPSDICHAMLARLSDDDDEALAHLAEARKSAQAADRSPGQYLVQEFELRLMRGRTDKLPELLQTIQMKYLDDPEVKYQLMDVLNKFGLISPDGSTVQLPANQTAEDGEGSQSGSGLWTPDQGVPVATDTGEASSEGESKLWVPGAD